MKTIIQSLCDEAIYPIPIGYVENICIKRRIAPETMFSADVSELIEYKGALADCLRSLVQSVNFSESDKSVGALTDTQRAQIIKNANSLYKEIGEPLIDEDKPMVFIGG